MLRLTEFASGLSLPTFQLAVERELRDDQNLQIQRLHRQVPASVPLLILVDANVQAFVDHVVQIFLGVIVRETDQQRDSFLDRRFELAIHLQVRMMKR